MSEEPDAPVETPESEAPLYGPQEKPEGWDEDQETPTPDEDNAPPEGEPAEVAQAQAPAVEPALGLDEFFAAHPMRPSARAMLTTWLRRTGKDVNGHYPLAEWEGHYQEMLRST